MSYLNATELVFAAGVTVGTNTEPYNLGQVASLIFEVGAEVDGYAAAAGYDVPIGASYPEAYAAMRRAVANGVQGVVMNTMFPNNPARGGSAGTLSNDYAAAYKRFRDGLASGKLILVGAPLAGEDDGRVLPRGGAIASARVTFETQF